MAQQIDEDLFSRQLAVYGRDAQRKVSDTRVLISGVNGLGIEIAKNVILAGVKSVVIHDTKTVSSLDLASQFYLSESDVGKKNRAEASLEQLKNLNPAVEVTASSAELTNDLVKAVTSVVLIDQPLSVATSVNEFCRTQSPPISFIRTDVRGLFGNIFCDFGDTFVVNDVDGEEVGRAIVTHISNSNPGIVTCLDEERIPWQDGDSVVFSEVVGMPELADGKPRVLKWRNPYSFTIEDTTNYGKYEKNGIATGVKVPKTISFKSLQASIADPGMFLESDFSKFGRPNLLHVCFHALDEWTASHGGELPKSGNDADADEFVKLVHAKNDAMGENKVEVDDKVVKAMAKGARGIVNPMCAMFGGIVGQEIIKACSGKFHPIQQWFNYDATECLPDDPPSEADCAPTGSRYDGQVAVFGKKIQDKIESLNYFLVGAGALGCEFLKNFAMMGVGCGAGGSVTVTDDDRIEKSNLSRQFLFRNWDVGQPKSSTAAKAAKVMNPGLNVNALSDRVSRDTEDQFDDVFWAKLDGVTNALDNVPARLYIDSRCVFFRKPLLESGTLGTKCNVQVVVPHKTENYGASADPPEKQAPDCTLHNFPHTINHCLSWGRSEFIGNFESNPQETNVYLRTDNYRESLKDANPNEVVEKLTGIRECLVTDRTDSFEHAIGWARRKFEDYFANRIKQLTFTFPEDAKTSSGALFWSPPKRFPTALVFDCEDKQHMEFIMAAANLRAEIFGVAKPEGKNRDPDYFRSVLKDVIVPEFTPKEGVKIKTDPNDNSGSSSAAAADVTPDTLLAELPEPKSVSSEMVPLEFEKDDDTNFHMDFIAAVGNLRARNYQIEEVDKLQAKLTAGRIIPAIATTTALATGLVCLELVKVIQDKPIEGLRNAFANLAIPLFALSEPMPPARNVSRTVKNIPDPINHPDYEEEEDIIAYPENWTVWDLITVDEGDLTLQEFIDYFKNKHGLELAGLSLMSPDKRAVPLYHPFIKSTKNNLNVKLSELYVTKGCWEIRENQTYYMPACNFVDKDQNSVETPEVVYKWR